MNTIQECIDNSLTDEAPDEETIKHLHDTLVAREQEMAETLQLVAVRFNLMPQIVAKVICELGLGEPCAGEVKEHIDAQYAELLEQIEVNRQAQNAKYEEMGLPIRMAPFEDPLAEGLVVEMTVPDTPEA